jgi:hypothetical protein
MEHLHRKPIHFTRKSDWSWLMFPVNVPLHYFRNESVSTASRFENASTMLVTSNILGTTIAWLGDLLGGPWGPWLDV